MKQFTNSLRVNSTGEDLMFRINQATAYDFTVDGVAEELLAAGDDRASEQQAGGGFVEQLESPVVDADLVHLQEQLGGRRRGAQDLRHFYSASNLLQKN